MIELRWKVDRVRDGMGNVQRHLEESVLQYRDVVERDGLGAVKIATEWEDVPTEYIEE